MRVIFLLLMAWGFFVSALFVMAVEAYAYAPTDPVRPKPRPLMDCWVGEDGTVAGCRVREVRG